MVFFAAAEMAPMLKAPASAESERWLFFAWTWSRE